MNWKNAIGGRLAAALLIGLLFLTACGQTDSLTSPAGPAPTVTGEPAAGFPTEPPPAPTDRPAAPVPDPPAPAAEPAVEPTAAPALPLPLTPSQGEGPYYPVEKPAETDSDLTFIAGASGPAVGEVLLLSGRLLLENGQPVPGAVVEIWQTDGGGVYLHPSDPNFARRDPNFQSYGESETAADGAFSFKTLYPQLYGSRPRHIHVKVRFDGRELLTTQFYFAGDERLQSDGLVAQAGEAIKRLLVDVAETTAADGSRQLTGQIDLVLPAGAIPSN